MADDTTVSGKIKTLVYRNDMKQIAVNSSLTNLCKLKTLLFPAKNFSNLIAKLASSIY